MQIRYDCPTDGCVAIVECEPFENGGPTMECPRCHTEHSITITTLLSVMPEGTLTVGFPLQSIS